MGGEIEMNNEKPINVERMTPLIQVFNMRRSLAFYRDILSFDVEQDSGDGDDSSWLLLRLGNIYLMLNDQYEPGHVPSAPPDERVRWHRDTCLYFGCPNLDAAYEYLKAKGLGIDPPTIAPYGMNSFISMTRTTMPSAFSGRSKPMNRHDLDKRWAETLRGRPTAAELERLAEAVAEVCASGDVRFRQHIRNRLKRIGEISGTDYSDEAFGPELARLVVANEIGFENWDALINSVENPADDEMPILFRYAVAAMERGDFSAFETMVGGPDRFHDQIVDWYEEGLFDSEPETLAEIFSAACMLGHTRTAGYLLDKGVDPYAGMKTGLSGFHYAASSGRLNVIKLLIDRKVPMEIKNMYGGTVWNQALWSAVNEHTPDHVAIIEALLEAGPTVEEGTLAWWEKQDVPSPQTKERVAAALRRYGIS